MKDKPRISMPLCLRDVGKNKANTRHACSLTMIEIMKLPDHIEVPCECGERQVKALFIKMLRPQ